MMKRFFPRINKGYWIGEGRALDSCPVFCPEEMALLERHKETIPDDLMLKYYEFKQRTGKSLLDYTLEVENPPAKPLNLGAKRAGDILEFLKSQQQLKF